MDRDRAGFRWRMLSIWHKTLAHALSYKRRSQVAFNGAHTTRGIPYAPGNISSIEFNPSDWADVEKP